MPILESMKLLHIDSSVLRGNSGSRPIVAAVVSRFRQTDPNLEFTYRDLGEALLSHLTPVQLPSDHPLCATAPCAGTTQEE